MYFTALLCTADCAFLLHCPLCKMYNTSHVHFQCALHCTALFGITACVLQIVHCTALHCSASQHLYCVEQHCPAVHCSTVSSAEILLPSCGSAGRVCHTDHSHTDICQQQAAWPPHHNIIPRLSPWVWDLTFVTLTLFPAWARCQSFRHGHGAKHISLSKVLQLWSTR